VPEEAVSDKQICPFLREPCIGGACAHWDVCGGPAGCGCCCHLEDVRLRRYILRGQEELNDLQREQRRVSAWARVKACATAEGFDAQALERAMTNLYEKPATPALPKE